MRGPRPIILLTLALLGGCRSAPVAQPRPSTPAAPPVAATPGPVDTLSSPTAPPLDPFVSAMLAKPTGELQLATALMPIETPATDATPVAASSIAPEVLAADTIPITAPPLRLDLFQTLEISLRQNPDLTVLRRNEGVAVGVVGVAQTYPFNPFIQVQATPFQDAKSGGPGTVYHYVLLMQTLQLGRQQQAREENAWAALQSVRWNILQAELLNVAQTERLYFTALYQRGLRDLAAAISTLNDQLLYVLERQLEAGQAAAADVAIVRLDNRAAHQQLALAEANYQTALLDLRRQLNVPIHAPLELAGDLADCRWQSPAQSDADPSAANQSPDLTQQQLGALSSELIASRPDVMAARADLAAARANLKLACGSRRPDLQIGPYYQRTESGTSYAGFRAQTDLPVWNNGVPLVRQREAEVRRQATALEQLQIRAQLEADAALSRYERALQLVSTSATGFTESLPTELQRLEQQFREGEVDVLRVVTARTSLIQVRRAHLDSLNEMAQATAVLTAATGLPAETLLRPHPTGPDN